MSLSLIDIFFLITVVILVLNGFRNGAVFSLLNLLALPIGAAVVYFYGPDVVAMLVANGITATPLIVYIVLFLGSVFILHIVSNFIRSIVHSVPLISQGDTLLGGAVGFVEAWLVWVILLALLGIFLGDVQHTTQIIPGLGIQSAQLQGWHDFYNQAISNSFFAKVNGLFIKTLPDIQQIPAVRP